MPTNYTGSASGRFVTDPVTISDPNDGELASAASNASAPKTLADFVKYILDNAGFTGVARTWNAIQTFAISIKARGNGDQVAAVITDLNPSGAYKLLWEAGATKKFRIYITALGEIILTLNAHYDSDTNWREDVNALHIRWMGTHDGPWHVQRVASGTAAWSDATWGYATDGTADVRAGRAALNELVPLTAANVAVSVALAMTMANPAAATAQLNKLSSLNVAKVLAQIPYGSGLTQDTVYTPATYGFGVVDGYNLASIERKVLGGTDHYMRITFAQALADANYIWHANDQPGNLSEAAWFFPKSKSASVLELYGTMTPVAGANAAKSFGTASGGVITLSVHGRQ